jgi:hypothetical protein
MLWGGGGSGLVSGGMLDAHTSMVLTIKDRRKKILIKRSEFLQVRVREA